MYKSQDLSLHVSLAQQLCNVLPQKWLNLYEFGLCSVKPIHVRETVIYNCALETKSDAFSALC